MKKDIDIDIKITWPGEYFTIVSVFSSSVYLSIISVNFLGGFEGVQFCFPLSFDSAPKALFCATSDLF